MADKTKTAILNLPKGAVAITAASLVYLMLMQVLTGLRPEHVILITAINILYYAGKPTRRFILGFSIFAVFGMLYDVMRAFPNYDFGTVDIAGLYNFEKLLFGINYQGLRLTPNEFFEATHTVAGDLTAGIFYLNWVPVPLAFALFLYYKDRRQFLNFSLTFLFVNIIGFCGYYIHPAAPPWYVKLYGFDLHLGTPGNTAALSRFDELVGAGIFHSIYAKNANVFAALPSLHCAYPVIVLYYAFKTRPRWLVYPLTIFMLGIWFAAVYSGHHYLTDVILGVLCAIIGIVLYQRVLMKAGWYRKFFERYLGEISR